MSDVTPKVELNCEGLNCPLPILKTKKAMDSLSVGDVLQVSTTDPGSVNDMDSWAKRTGNELVSHTEAAGVHTFLLRKQ
jgi:tRNA 2-thiouridine synthesizing protein A